MKTTLSSLKAALVAEKRPPAVAAEPAPAPKYKQPASREGTTNITAYLPEDYKTGLRLVQAKTKGSLQSLIAEALNDLFRKHGVPALD